LAFNKTLSNHQQIRRFRIIVAVFFICLTLPLAMIVYYGFQKFENEMLFQYRWKSSNVLVKMNKTLSERLSTEQQRSPKEYYYYQSADDEAKQSSVYRSNTSPLARDIQPHYLKDLHGLIGFFNIVDQRHFNSPLLPFASQTQNLAAKLVLSAQRIDDRLAKIVQLKQILIENNLLQAGVEQEVPGLSFSSGDEIAKVSQVSNFQVLETRKKQLIFYRNARINQQSSVQGFIVDKDEFLYRLLGIYIRRAGYNNMVQVQLIDKSKNGFSHYYHYDIDKQGEASIAISNEPNNSLVAMPLFTGELVRPFQNSSVAFTTGYLPLGPATSFVLLFILVLSFVIIAGTIGFYWLGVKQIALAEQRMNFVSSVSHELKTPLTSILMYSEMLKSGMVKDQQNQQDYYHFIFDESERLSRLINNVLQLSKLSRNQEVVSPEFVSIDVLKNLTQAKVSTLISKNNFQLNFIIDEKIPANSQVFLDLDAFSQIVINLIDNAVKFYNAAKINDPQRQKIDVSFAFDQSPIKRLSFSIRDYGPGISNSQLDKIFELFFRGGNEMIRTTSGTGIGLALVHQLVIAQGGEIQVIREQQGVSFVLTFPAR
jgi:signal transduction histidine kinase